MSKCNQLTSLPLKGLTEDVVCCVLSLLMSLGDRTWLFAHA